MLLDVADQDTIRLLDHYLHRLRLPTDALRVTTDRATFARWLGRRVSASLGGAYVFLPRLGEHAILINLPRIDRDRPRALEVVVAEELLHMRDHLDGDRRRHAKHGYDRIAHRVAALTGATLEEIRGALKPVAHRPPRFLYACPACHVRVARRVRGTWSCGRCSPVFDPRFRLRLVADAGLATGVTDGPG
jgi:predicted SprT family Zn-dependent metalloprotease